MAISANAERPNATSSGGARWLIWLRRVLQPRRTKRVNPPLATPRVINLTATKDIVYCRNTDGHRQSYVDLFAEHLRLVPLAGPIRWSTFVALVGARRLLFATIDDDYAGFILVATIRSILRKRTVAMFLRPASCFRTDGLIHLAKRWVFQRLKHLPGLTVLAITPFDLKPAVASVAHDWVHDPQLWDLGKRSVASAASPLGQQIAAHADGRKVLAFIGSARTIKGFQYLNEIFAADPDVQTQIHVVVAGRIAKDCADAASQLRARGATIEDRHITDAEMTEVYQRSEFIWCCYRSDYDQPSGIFGRAVQLGRKPIVRAGSLIAHYDLHTGTDFIRLPYGTPLEAARQLLALARMKPAPVAVPTTAINQWRDDFVTTCNAAL